MFANRSNRLVLALRAGLAIAVGGFAIAPGSGRAVSFPDYPLQTGSPLPPNILFILDDSGSMGFLRMPTDTAGELDDTIANKSSLSNTIYYDPAVTYLPWMTSRGVRMTGGTSFRAAYGDYDRASGNTVDLADSDSCRWFVQNGAYRSVCGGPEQATYYVLKSGQTADPSKRGRYFRYQIRLVGTAVRVVRSEYTSSGTTSTSMGCPDPGYGTSGWRNCTYATPGRAEADEITNFATWFSYHRSRMKMAKAGAAEAFAPLGSDVRVGFRTIWNRDSFDIPVQDGNSGLFEDATTPVTTTSRSTWFARLANAYSYDGTPLQGALQKAGDYFSLDTASGPYGPQSGAQQFQCRQNFAILTTDGYWNASDNFDSGAMGEQDNVDGSAIYDPRDQTTSVRYRAAPPYSSTTSNTLGDIAMKYWKNDLRTDLANKVPTSSSNPAFWQHMSTFGISIGNKGGLDQGSVSEILRDGSPRINGVNVPWPMARSGASTANIDDLLHAAVNGHGEFIAATNATAFSKALSDVLGKIQEQLASGSNVATNSTSFQSDTRMYQAKFTAGKWIGDLEAYDVTATGGIAPNATWKTSERIVAGLADSDPANDFTARPVLTWDGSRTATFPTSAQESALARVSSGASISGADVASYLKGSRTLELSNPNGKLRNRAGLIGDIVDSSPFYLKDNETIFVGANDGMLHAINALTGDVRYSYVPAGLNFTKLSSFADPYYEHAYFVDGPIAVSAANTLGDNYLVGSLGRGGKGVYALDVSSTTAPTALWDNTGSTDNDMGYVLGVPLIAKANAPGNNTRTVAIVSNGIDSVNGSATLFIYDVDTGNLRRKFVVDTGGNGLSAPRAADTDGDGDIDYVYAGDLKGNLWKFDLTNGNSSSWSVAFSGQPMFTTASNQPITGGLAIAREPGTRRIFITFGTGRLISQGDMTTTNTQALYAVIDDGTRVQISDLAQRSIVAVGTVGSRTVRAFQSYAALPAGKKGWYINLGNPTVGERVVSGPRIRGRAAFYSSVIPASGGASCDPGGTGFLNVVDLFTGTSPQTDGTSSSFLDLNGNGTGTDDTITSGGQQVPIGSVDLGVGMPTESSQIDKLVVVGGSTGGHAGISTAGISGLVKRVGWREIYDRN